MIESHDSQKLADALNKECARINRAPLSVLVQVLAHETEKNKFGVKVEETIPLIKHIMEKCPYLRFKGIMSMGEIGSVEQF